MKKIVDRFIAEDTDGRRFTVMCIKEYDVSNDSSIPADELGTSFQTTSGELLTPGNNSSFKIANTNRFLRRVGVERSAQGVLRIRSFSLGL